MGEVAHRFSDQKTAATSPLARVESERKGAASAAVSRIMRKADGSSAGKGEIPQGNGSPLAADVRQRMEPKLGADLSSVKVHTAGSSAQAASNYGARAFTVGSDVHFAAGQFAPGTKEGDRLLAHELTHVVQGSKTSKPTDGVHRKEDEKGGESKGDAEVSQGHEPAEVEADTVGDKVADELHDSKGGEGGDKKKDKKKGGPDKGGKDKDKKGGEHEAEGKEHEGEGKEGEETKEKPAAEISAKLEGVGTKLWRAKDNKNKPAEVTPGSINDTTSKLSANTSSSATDAVTKFSKSSGKYDTNFAACLAKVSGKGGKGEDLAKIQGKKAEWYQKWGSAVLSKDAAAGTAILAQLENDLKTLFPEDKASAGGGSLYTGRTNNPAPGGGAQTGRQRAEGATQAGNDKKDGITYRTLETTLIGSLFDGVANDPQDPAEKEHWIPYWGSAAGKWWSQISGSYAKTFTGEVNAFVDIGFPYMVGKFVKTKGWTTDQAKANKAELAGVIKLDGSVFRDDELPRVADGMKEGRVSKMVVQLRMETSAGVFKTASVTVDGNGIAGGPMLIARVDAGIAGHVTVDDIFKNIK